MGKGNPYCRICDGVGGYHDATGWRKCPCVTGTKASRRLLSIAHELPGRPRLTATQMRDIGSSQREGE